MEKSGKLLYLTQIIPAEISEKSISYHRYVNSNVTSFKMNSTYKSFNDFITIYVLTKYFYEQNNTKVELMFTRYTEMYKNYKHQIVGKINSIIFANMCYSLLEKVDGKLSKEDTKRQILLEMTDLFEGMLSNL